jgi:hypothetical protein
MRAYCKAWRLKNYKRAQAAKKRYRLKLRSERPTIHPRPCHMCGKPFTPLPNNVVSQRFCCATCRRWRPTIQPRPCDVCGALFTPIPRQAGSQRYCCEAHRRLMERLRSKKAIRRPTTCVVCGVEFTPSRSNRQRFCGKRCRRTTRTDYRKNKSKILEFNFLKRWAKASQTELQIRRTLLEFKRWCRANGVTYRNLLEAATR